MRAFRLADWTEAWSAGVSPKYRNAGGDRALGHPQWILTTLGCRAQECGSHRAIPGSGPGDRWLTESPRLRGKERLALGSLYAESACEFLAHHIIHAHSTVAAPPSLASGGLAARRLKIVLDYIEENLAEPISLHRLAELAGVSARHFERAFRQALGVPPHAYVLGKRVEAAQRLLACFLWAENRQVA